MDLNALGNELKITEKQLGQYTSELPSQIQGELQKAYTPILQESTGVTRDMMGDYLQRYYDTTSMGAGMTGNTAYDLNPTQKLGVMGRELGTMAGNLQASQKYSDYLGAQMNDMYSKALQASQLGQQNLADKYARQFQQYQLAWQEAESAKDRAAAGGGGGGNIYITGDNNGGSGNGGGGNGNGDDDDITVDDTPWLQKFANNTVSKGTAPLGKSSWLKTTPNGTAWNLLGNLIGNIQVPKNKDQSFLDKLLNR